MGLAPEPGEASRLKREPSKFGTLRQREVARGGRVQKISGIPLWEVLVISHTQVNFRLKPE